MKLDFKLNHINSKCEPTSYPCGLFSMQLITVSDRLFVRFCSKGPKITLKTNK